MPPLPLRRKEAEHYESLVKGVHDCEHPQLRNVVDGRLYITCPEGFAERLFALNRQGEILASTHVAMHQVTKIEAAGTSAIAVTGYNDGAAMRNELSILHAGNLRRIVHHLMEDSTFLGVINGRAYIDDYCCFGRGDKYAPATIYSISLKDATESPRIDLAPDPGLHSGYPPVGQGARNYLIGRYFYVVVSPITYRYDMLNFRTPPKRMGTPATPLP